MESGAAGVLRGAAVAVGVAVAPVVPAGTAAAGLRAGDGEVLTHLDDHVLTTKAVVDAQGAVIKRIKGKLGD